MSLVTSWQMGLGCLHIPSDAHQKRRWILYTAFLDPVKGVSGKKQDIVGVGGCLRGSS